MFLRRLCVSLSHLSTEEDDAPRRETVAAEPTYPQGPGNNYEAQLKTREKLCPIFIIIHLSRIEFTLEFSLGTVFPINTASKED